MAVERNVLQLLFGWGPSGSIRLDGVLSLHTIEAYEVGVEEWRKGSEDILGVKVMVGSATMRVAMTKVRVEAVVSLYGRVLAVERSFDFFSMFEVAFPEW